MRWRIVVIPDPEERGYTVTVPALPGCVTQSDTLPEAYAMAREAITEYLDGETPESLAAAGVNLGIFMAEIEVPIAVPV